MPTDVEAVQRAARAAALRAVARRLEQCPWDDLIQRNGCDTWIGPTADTCRESIAAARQLVDGAAALLRTTAAQLELPVLVGRS